MHPGPALSDEPKLLTQRISMLTCVSPSWLYLTCVPSLPPFLCGRPTTAGDVDGPAAVDALPPLSVGPAPRTEPPPFRGISSGHGWLTRRSIHSSVQFWEEGAKGLPGRHRSLEHRTVSALTACRFCSQRCIALQYSLEGSIYLVQ